MEGAFLLGFYYLPGLRGVIYVVPVRSGPILGASSQLLLSLAKRFASVVPFKAGKRPPAKELAQYKFRSEPMFVFPHPHSKVHDENDDGDLDLIMQTILKNKTNPFKWLLFGDAGAREDCAVDKSLAATSAMAAPNKRLLLRRPLGIFLRIKSELNRIKSNQTKSNRLLRQQSSARGKSPPLVSSFARRPNQSLACSSCL